jgi:hypothetical protein
MTSGAELAGYDASTGAQSWTLDLGSSFAGGVMHVVDAGNGNLVLAIDTNQMSGIYAVEREQRRGGLGKRLHHRQERFPAGLRRQRLRARRGQSLLKWAAEVRSIRGPARARRGGERAVARQPRGSGPAPRLANGAALVPGFHANLALLECSSAADPFTIEAYSMPGESLSPSGWVQFGGSPGLGQRPR